MDRIGITCLGSGAALGEEKFWSSILIDGKILFDLPPTVIPQLYRTGKDIAAIDHIFISHFHADHSFGIPFFLLLYHFLLSRDRPLYIIGPQGLEEKTEKLCALAWPELVKRGLAPGLSLKYVEIKGDGEYRAGDMLFHAVRMEHFDLDAYGYRFSYNGREIAYTGDTGECPQLHRLIDRADIVITELTYPVPADDPGHLDVRAVARIGEEVHPSGTVLATHLGGNPSPIDGIIFCHDGETYLI